MGVLLHTAARCLEALDWQKFSPTETMGSPAAGGPPGIRTAVASRTWYEHVGRGRQGTGVLLWPISGHQVVLVPGLNHTNIHRDTFNSACQDVQITRGVC